MKFNMKQYILLFFCSMLLSSIFGIAFFQSTYAKKSSSCENDQIMVNDKCAEKSTCNDGMIVYKDDNMLVCKTGIECPSGYEEVSEDGDVTDFEGVGESAIKCMATSSSS